LDIQAGDREDPVTAQHDQSMIVKPSACELQQSLPIEGARELVPNYPQQRAALCVG
jgi:hypothetical protein